MARIGFWVRGWSYLLLAAELEASLEWDPAVNSGTGLKVVRMTGLGDEMKVVTMGTQAGIPSPVYQTQSMPGNEQYTYMSRLLNVHITTHLVTL
jgi:hypothetical protein